MPKVAFDSSVVQMPSPVQPPLPILLRPMRVHTPVVVYVVDGKGVLVLRNEMMMILDIIKSYSFLLFVLSYLSSFTWVLFSVLPSSTSIVHTSLSLSLSLSLSTLF